MKLKKQLSDSIIHLLDKMDEALRKDMPVYVVPFMIVIVAVSFAVAALGAGMFKVGKAVRNALV